MSKIYLSQDERHPCYYLDDERGDASVDVDGETLTRWRAAEDAWEAAQTEMGEIYRAAGQAQKLAKKIEQVEREVAAAQERLAELREQQL